MLFVFPILYMAYKVVHKTKMFKPEEVDLHGELDAIEEYERSFVPQAAK